MESTCLDVSECVCMLCALIDERSSIITVLVCQRHEIACKMDGSCVETYSIGELRKVVQL